MFTFKNWKKVLQSVMWNDFPSFLTCFFFWLVFLPPSLLVNSHILRSVRWPPIPPCTRDYWWTLDFANMPSFPRAELVTSLGAVGLAIILPIMTKSMTSFPSGSVPVSHVPKFYSSVFHIAIIGKNSEMFAIHITKSVVLSSILNPAY
jgi:hypothetical protein